MVTERIRDRFLMHLDTTNNIENHILTNGSWEPHVSILLDVLVQPGFRCIDVGANSGYHTLDLAARVGPTGHIDAFEPNPRIFARMMANIRLNPDLSPRISVHELGVSNQNGSFFAADAGPIGNGVVRTTRAEAAAIGECSPCTCVTLDAALGDRKVDLIKVDVEGMELEVFEGALEIIRREQPYLLFETLSETFSVEKLARLESLLSSLGYFFFSYEQMLGKLAIVSPSAAPYPDTLGVPTSKLHRIAPLAAVAGRGIIKHPKTSAPEAIVTIVGLSPTTIFISTQHVDGSSFEDLLARAPDAAVLTFAGARGVLSVGSDTDIRFHPTGDPTDRPLFDLEGTLTQARLTSDRQWVPHCTPEELARLLRAEQAK